MKSDIVECRSTGNEYWGIRENVYLMGCEMWVEWILMVWVVLRRRGQSAMPWPIFEIDAIRQISAGQSEYLLSMPVSIAASFHWLISGNRWSRKSRQRHLPGMVSYLDDLLHFQAGRLAIS
jgi:hypothetical protein